MMNKKEKLNVLLETYKIDIIPNKGTSAEEVTEVYELAIDVQPVLENVFKGSAAQAIAMLNELKVKTAEEDEQNEGNEETNTNETASDDLEDSESSADENASDDLEDSESSADENASDDLEDSENEEDLPFIQDDKLYQLTCNWQNCLYGQTFRGRTVKELGVPEAHLDLIEG